LACPFYLFAYIVSQLGDIENPSPTELGGTGYFTVSGHVLDLPAADPEDGLCLLDLATLTLHHATIHRKPNLPGSNIHSLTILSAIWIGIALPFVRSTFI
jgi:hypothetical protein